MSSVTAVWTRFYLSRVPARTHTSYSQPYSQPALVFSPARASTADGGDRAPRGTFSRCTPAALWGEAGAPGGTVRRAADPQCGNGAPALLVSTSTNFPIRLIRGQIWKDLKEYTQIELQPSENSDLIDSGPAIALA